MPDKFQPLRFPAGKRVERLSEAQITKPDFLQDCKRTGERFAFLELVEKMHRLAHGHLEQLVEIRAA